MKNNRCEWIDFLKSIAMLAVILDHTYMVLFTNRILWLHTGFSVTLFILLSGITASLSIQKHKIVIKNWQYLFNKILFLSISYIIASIINHLVDNSFHLDLNLLIFQLVTFSATPPFYFVLFYSQLILVSVLIFKIFNKYKSLSWHIFLLIILYYISFIFNTHPFTNKIILGGRFLFGGSYLFVFSLGIFFSIYLKKLLNNKLILNLLSLISLIFFECNNMIERIWSNPPNMFLIFYTLIIFFLFYSFYNLFVLNNKYLYKIISLTNVVGRYSLYVFLYHKMFINLGLNYINFDNQFINKLLIFLISFVPCVLIGFLVNKIKSSPLIEKLVLKRNFDNR